MIAPSALNVAVLIVNYNTADLALAAVESVLNRKHGGRPVEIHLVDNASPAGDGAKLANTIENEGWSKRVTLYRETENHGFGRGNNLVLHQLAKRLEPPRYVFLLNPDARLENEAIAVMADFLDAHSDAAAVGANIRKPDGNSVTAAFRFPNPIATFASALAFGPITRIFFKWQVPLEPDITTRRVDWVAGAAVMFRWTSLCEAGYFDPAYFLYFEEVDLMRQISRRGEQVWYLEEAHVIHIEGASTGVKSRSKRRRLPAYWYNSWQYYFRKNHGRAGVMAAAVAWLTGAFGNAVVALLRGRTPAAPDKFFGDFWAMVLRPILGLGQRPYD